MKKYSIRADFNGKTIVVYQAFQKSIAIPAIQNNKLVDPFSTKRMTWIKPSYLWLMHRSCWGQMANMEYILRIHIYKKHWEQALKRAVLTTPEKRVYPCAKSWRKKLEKTSVRIQWDPERDIEGNKLQYSSIQVGLEKSIIEDYANKWIYKIENFTEKTHQIYQLIQDNQIEKATSLLPKEKIYSVRDTIKKQLGMCL